MSICNICPRNCNVDRAVKTGFCSMTDTVKISRAALHMWEEPCISGTGGSGAIFFSGCNMKCVFCQNYSISTEGFGKEISDSQLMNIFDSLIESGVHNINLVNPTHYAARLEKVLREYNSPVPVVYNSGGYEKVETLKRLEGLIDIYLPDLKYINDEKSKKYSGAPDYFRFASQAIKEMIRQTGSAVFDEEGIMKKGTVIRHLILPKNTNQSIEIINWLKDNVPNDTYISLMSQYTPIKQNESYPELNRRITPREYAKVLDYLLDSGFENIFAQEALSADEAYIPDFDLTGICEI